MQKSQKESQKKVVHQEETHFSSYGRHIIAKKQ